MAPENETDVLYLEEHLKKNPDSILFARLADAYLKDNRIEEAIQLCEDGLKKHPHYVTAHMILGKCYLAKKLYDQAEKEFKRVLLFDPKYLAAHKYYGDLMREIGWENTCELSYKKILQIDPLDELAQSMVGDYVIEGGSAPEEMQTFEPEPKEPEAELGEVAPMTETPEDEEMLFQEQEQPETEAYPGPEEEQEPEIDAKKAEEFSYILEDIFKDEVADEDSKKYPPPESKKEEENQANQGVPDSYLADLQFSEQKEETLSQEEESESTTSEILDLIEDVDETGSQIKTPSASSEVDDTEPLPKPIKPHKSEGEKIVTPTLGEIYAAQGQYSKAISVFETLLKKHPENETYFKKIEYLKQKLTKSKNAPKN